MHPLPQTFLNAIGHRIDGWRGYREARRTERLIGDLPLSIRKDIGWPVTCLREAGPRDQILRR